MICSFIRQCTNCDNRVWHNFEQYDPEFGEHWTIVPELIGDGTWDDIITWLSNTQNYVSCFNRKCNSCANGQGNRITHFILDWYEQVYSNGFSACYRAVICPACGDDVFAEAKVHNFVGDTCVDCGATK
jgi:hypothetical protein